MEQNYEKNWIKPPCEVAHIDNPNLKMRAECIVRKSKQLGDGNVMELVIGVKCVYFENNRPKYLTCNTRSLIPWEVALGGPEAIIKFRNHVR